MSLDNDPLVAPSSEQNAELTPTENQGPRVVPCPYLPVGPPRRPHELFDLLTNL